MHPYPAGTLVKIEKLATASGIVDTSKDNMYGYVTDRWKAPASGSTYYVVSIFPNGNKLNCYEHYLSPVTE